MSAPTEQDRERAEAIVAAYQSGIESLPSTIAAALQAERERTRAEDIEKVRFLAGEWYTNALGNGAAFSDKANTAHFIADELQSLESAQLPHREARCTSKKTYHVTARKG